MGLNTIEYNTFFTLYPSTCKHVKMSLVVLSTGLRISPVSLSVSLYSETRTPSLTLLRDKNSKSHFTPRQELDASLLIVLISRGM
ncbi:secreted frizzled-related protein 5 X4 [Biomphalaria glabrata]|nr:secreted frizzled-related protein 5 X4 [Biomphalaria glabrata]